MLPASLHARARQLDAADSLSRFRSRFHLPAGVIYLNGNSLGPLSVDAEAALNGVLRDWRDRAGAAWHDSDPPWTSRAERLGERMAALFGAWPDEVIATGSTTVNLHQILASFFRPLARKDKLLIDGLAFPSDRYAVRSHLRLRGLDPAESLKVVPPGPDGFLREEEIVEALTPDVALAVLPSVVFTTGQLLDLKLLNAEARRRDVLLALDCSHSVGCVPLDFRDLQPDFAFWCGYKYLGGGPGSVAGLYLNRRHRRHPPGLVGWFGMRKDRQFLMPDEFEPAEGAARLQIGTPALLSLAPLEGALCAIEEAGIEAIRAKSVRMTDFLIACADSLPSELGARVASPRDSRRRGAHIALSVSDAEDLWKQLGSGGVVCDYRSPNLIRLAPSSLYNTFQECAGAMERLACCLQSLETKASRESIPA